MKQWSQDTPVETPRLAVLVERFVHDQRGGDRLTLVADMRGVIKENLEIDVDQGILSIKAATENGIKGEALYREFRPSGYYRQFRLLEDFDAAKADAELKNGVLTLRLPKAEAAKPRKIAVKTVH